MTILTACIVGCKQAPLVALFASNLLLCMIRSAVLRLRFVQELVGTDSAAASLCVPDWQNALVSRARHSTDAATTSSSAGPPSRDSAGSGFGFRTRFKDMSEHELLQLLEQTKQMGGAQKKTQGPVKVKPPIPEYKSGQFAQQWTRLEEPIEPYKSPDINQTDMYAVIEAGHSQYKGARP